MATTAMVMTEAQVETYSKRNALSSWTKTPMDDEKLGWFTFVLLWVAQFYGAHDGQRQPEKAVSHASCKKHARSHCHSATSLSCDPPRFFTDGTLPAARQSLTFRTNLYRNPLYRNGDSDGRHLPHKYMVTWRFNAFAAVARPTEDQQSRIS